MGLKMAEYLSVQLNILSLRFTSGIEIDALCILRVHHTPAVF